MINFLESVIDFLSMAGSYLSNTVQGLFSMINLIPQTVLLTTYSIEQLPGQIGIFALAGVGVCVVLHIIGR